MSDTFDDEAAALAEFAKQLAFAEKLKRRNRVQMACYAFLLKKNPAYQRYIRWHIWDITTQRLLRRQQWYDLAVRIHDIALHGRAWLPIPSLAFYMHIPNGGTATRICYMLRHDGDGYNYNAYLASLKNA